MVTSDPMPDQGLTYGASGVDIGEQNRAIRLFRDAVRSTYNESVLSDVGSFGGLFSTRFEGMVEPLLVSSIDGVGTKTKIAIALGMYEGLGRDIVGHSVNDILAQGAKPLFFLDYFATSKLSAEIVRDVVQGAAEACRANGCVLIGGEIAELPGVYSEGEIDVVGAIVGVVDREKVLPKHHTSAGDLLIGLASDGLHTNGYSLARKALFEVAGKQPDEEIPELGRTIGEELLRPHRCYFRALEPLLEEGGFINAIAHITGGGFYENIPRVIPQDCRAVVERRSWTPQPIFQMIQQAGDVPDDEMYRTFNMGIGMVLVCPSVRANAVLQRLNESGESAYMIGELSKGGGDVAIV
ncbi:MAG: Phosphoribosylformylglycinamidine cyclo-ligase [Fimbriimonadales bacterium]|nr:Phosphoribosylformylglycinamidine cyclo-ligase [Fimbriimonadales bacterium]